ncbi:MAG: dihydrodipicolinate synthase family protein [Alistipes sp.]|nr:dihydrodipicolinate synthase family protein [Alistipes sp.]
MNGGANMFPSLYVEMYRAAASGDTGRVRELQARIMAISTSLYTIGQWGSSYLKGVKCALSLMGICSDHLSLPYRKFRQPQRDKVREALVRLGVNVSQ